MSGAVAVIYENVLSQVAVQAIQLYRRFISPHKGFKCAHHVLHQNGSCSDLV